MHAVTVGVDGHCSPLLALAADVNDNGVTPPESRRTNRAGGLGGTPRGVTTRHRGSGPGRLVFPNWQTSSEIFESFKIGARCAEDRFAVGVGAQP